MSLKFLCLFVSSYRSRFPDVMCRCAVIDIATDGIITYCPLADLACVVTFFVAFPPLYSESSLMSSSHVSFCNSGNY